MNADREPSARDCASPSCGCGPLARRDFLRIAGLGAAALSPLGAALPRGVQVGLPRVGFLGAEEAASGPAGKIEHFVPAEKKLDPAWVRALFERGERRVWRGAELEKVGMPVGGIGAGQLYLRGDGTLGVWEIFNRHHFSGFGESNYRGHTVDAPVEQGFTVVAESEGKSIEAGLNRKDFPAVEFTGEHPIGRVRYRREDFPLGVELEAFSPFIPLSAADSGLPATLFHLTLENTSGKPVAARIRASLENAVCRFSAPEVRGRRVSRVVNERGRGMIVHRAEAAPEPERPVKRAPIPLADFEGPDYGGWKVTGEAFGQKPAGGTLEGQQKVSGFEGKGLVNTYLGGDRPQGTLTSPPFKIERQHLNFLLGGGDHPGETCLNLLVDGKVVRTATGKSNEKLEWRSFRIAELQGKEGRIEIVDHRSDGWGHINADSIELADERRNGPTGPIEKLEDYGTLVLACAEAAAAETAEERWPIDLKRVVTLETARIDLAAGEKRSVAFVLAWHFPNHAHGNAYAGRFRDALEVAQYVLENEARLSGDTRRWHDVYRDSTLPRWLLERLAMPVSTLATGTCQWWGNGRFWAWEGVGCCEGTCAHVWNYAHAMARLFPELERNVRERQDLDAAFHESGLVGFRGERNGAYAADGQAGTVLKCYREHLMSADGEFLKRNWPRIRKVLEFSIGQDRNDDGLIEASQHNTYDINFEGANTFVGALYLAALRAGEEMAREAGDAEFADRARKIYESGWKLTQERLWNGEYYFQEVDLKKFPKFQYGQGCLSDQLFGQGWAHHVALGYIYPRERVERALRSIWKYNWAPDVAAQNAAHKPDRFFAMPGEAGLLTCTWPRSAHLKEGVLYRDEVWTGIEYQVAGHMIWEGMLEEALAIVRAIDERYAPAKRNPFNEIECGDHYARALASWGVYTALAGSHHHGPRGHLAFAPRITPEDFRAAFTTAEGWGSFAQKRAGGRQEESIALAWGKLRLRTLAFELPEKKFPTTVAVTINGKVHPANFISSKNRVTVELGEEVTLKAGEKLEVLIG